MSETPVGGAPESPAAGGPAAATTTVPPAAGSAAEIVREMARRFAAGDMAGAFSLYDPAVRLQQPASLPHGGRHTGLDGVTAMGTLFAEHWERTIADPRILDAGPSAAVQVTTQTWTARATGRSATVDVVELFTAANGLITEIRVFQQDTAALLATLEA